MEFIKRQQQPPILPVVSRTDNGNKLYTINLLSRQLTENASSISDMTYYFDFGLLPMGKYLVTFTYLGKYQRLRQNNNAVNRLEKVFQRPYVFCDLGQSNVYMPDNKKYSSNPSSKLLGYLFTREVPLDSNGGAPDLNFFNATNTMNAPIYLNRRPNQNEIRIQIEGYDWVDNEFSRLAISGISYYNANDNRFPKDYSLSLHFELLE
jgi:hypothetical protein